MTMTIRILPESSANQNLYGAKKDDYLLLAEISYTGGEYTDTYYVDKSGLLWVVGDWFTNKPHGFHLEELAMISSQIGYSRLAMISHAIHVFLNKFDLERSWSSQKEHNQSDTPTSKDKIIASLVAQVNGLATNLSNLESFNNNLEGELNAHRQTECLQLDDINRRLNDHTNLENTGLGSIVDRLNEIEIELHNNPGKVLDWAHVNEVPHTAIIAQLRQEMRDFVLEDGEKIASLEKKVERLQNLTRFMANEITALEVHTKLPLDKPVGRFRTHKSRR